MATGTQSGLGTWRFTKTSAETRALRKAMDALQLLRTVMDNAVCGAIGYHQPYGKDATRFYYGPDDPNPATQNIASMIAPDPANPTIANA